LTQGEFWHRFGAALESPRRKIFVAAVLAAPFAVGCGSDDDSTGGGSNNEAVIDEAEQDAASRPFSTPTNWH
jgi:hypothetical protein